MKKVISLFMAFVMLLSVTSGLALTANAETITSGTCNENLSWQYDPSTKTMTFNGKGELFFDKGGDYCGVPLPWQNTVDDDDIEKIVISDGITYVKFSSFSDCTNIKEFDLGKDVRELESINPGTIHPVNHKYFKTLEKININSNNPYMISVDGVVYNKNKTMLICYPCGREATEYTIANGVKSIELSCFSYSKNLEKISIPNSLKTIGYNAFGNSGIVDLTIPDSVNLIEGDPFYDCKSLKTVKVGNGVTRIEAFSGCDNLETIELGSNIECISGNFNESLKTIIIPKSLKEIGSNVFENCYNLEKVYYSGSESDWDKILIGSGNNGLFITNIQYNFSPTDQPDTVPTPGGGSTGGGAAPAPTTDDSQKTEEQKPTTSTTTATTTSTQTPAAVKVSKTKAKKNALAVFWNKMIDVSGYQIQVATDKKFKKNKKTVTVAKQNASKKTVKKLKSKKKYYVRVRSYKIVNGKKAYGKWSKIKSVKTK